MRLNRQLAAGAMLVALSAIVSCGDDPVDPPDDDGIAISFSQDDINVVQGGSEAVTITLTRLGGYAGVVTLSITGLPEGATATFDPQQLSGSATTSMLQIDVAEDAPGGVAPFDLAVNAEGPGVDPASEALTLTIEEAESAGRLSMWR